LFWAAKEFFYPGGVMRRKTIGKQVLLLGVVSVLISRSVVRAVTGISRELNEASDQVAAAVEETSVSMEEISVASTGEAGGRL